VTLKAGLWTRLRISSTANKALQRTRKDRAAELKRSGENLMMVVFAWFTEVTEAANS
jgi:hypothetical protein